MSEMSYADMRAACGNDGMFGGNGIWFLALLFLMNGGGLWGNGRANPATTEDLASGFNFQALQNKGNETLAAIQQTNQNLSNAVCQLGYQSLDHAKSLAQQLSECCCSVKQEIGTVKFDMANYASAIMANDTANSQKVLDKLCQMEMSQKDAMIYQQGQRIAALEADARMCGVVRWPTSMSYATMCNPFFGGYTCNTCSGQVMPG